MRHIIYHLSGNEARRSDRGALRPHNRRPIWLARKRRAQRWVDEQNALTQSYLVRAECRKIMKIGCQLKALATIQHI
jgi:hypothetical protein